MAELILPVLLLILGLVLLVAEDLLPTGGALGVLAAVCFLFLLYLGFSSSTALGLGYLGAEVLLIPVTYVVSSFLIAKTGLGRLVFLRPPESHEVELAIDRPDPTLLVGQRGRVLTTLRPAGTVDFEGLRLEGIAEEGMILAGSPVLAVRVRSGRLVVRHADESDQESPSGDE